MSAIAKDALEIKRADARRPIIRAVALSKCYRIYEHPQDRLKQALWSRVSRFTHWFTRRSEIKTYYREFWALRNVSFEVRPGETLGVLGRNGAGKSTLLQIVAGTLTPTSGSVDVHGQVAALLELGSGFNPDFTGRENVYLNAALLGLSREEVDARFDQIAAFADIGDFIEQPIKTYSSGMMLRLAFAVQTAVKPSVLIVDEALAVGDARFQRKCYDRLERYRAEGGTVLFVTHDTGAIVQLCSRAMLLERGEVIEVGEPQWVVKIYHRLLFGEPDQQAVLAANVEPHPGPTDAVQEEPVRRTRLPEVTPNARHEELSDGSSTAKRALRYGSRALEIVEVGIRDPNGNATTLLELGCEYLFYFNVRYHVEFNEKVSFGFTITNTRGIEIYGTKGGLHDCFLPPAASGSLVEAKMQLSMDLVAGDYFLTVAVAPITEKAAPEFFDMRFDALQFRVVGIPRCFTTSIVDLRAKLWFEMVSSPQTPSQEGMATAVEGSSEEFGH